MKKVLIIVGTLIIVVLILLAIFPPRKISHDSGFGGGGPYIYVCKGMYWQTYNDTPFDGPRGGYCFGKVIQEENPYYRGQGERVPPPAPLKPKPIISPIISNPGTHTLATGKMGTYYSASLPFDPKKDPEGTATLNPELIAGSLPPGIQMSMPSVNQTLDYPSSQAALSLQYISGTPSASGTYLFTIRYSQNPYYAEKYSITIVP